jgi:hypothetical protein
LRGEIGVHGGWPRDSTWKALGVKLDGANLVGQGRDLGVHVDGVHYVTIWKAVEIKKIAKTSAPEVTALQSTSHALGTQQR